MSTMRLRASAAARLTDVGKGGRSGDAHVMLALRYSGAAGYK